MKRYAYILGLLFLLALTACGAVTGGKSVGGQDNVTVERRPLSAEPRELTDDELGRWSDFLSQMDCYGFLMSSYQTPLDASLGEVFYSGAGEGQYATDEMVADFLEAEGFEEAYTDITFISYASANKILERRTGYTLEHFKLAGNDLPMYYSEKYGGYFHMAGDTNYIRVKCVSGTEYPDGSVKLNSHERTWGDEDDDYTNDESVSTFETVLKPDAQSSNFLFDSNLVTGGWLLWYQESYPDIESDGMDVWTLDAPPFEYTWNGEPDTESTYPVTLETIREEENGVSMAEEWAEEHWNEWMSDPAFAERYGEFSSDFTALQRLNFDPDFVYAAGDTVLDIYDAEYGDWLYSLDFTSWLSPDGSLSADALGAQIVRFPRMVNGNLYVSNFHRTYAEESGGLNGYVSCLNLWDGSLLWRSAPLVCNSDNFVVLGVNNDGYISQGVIVCGYGFTAEDDYIYQLSLDTGEVLDRTSVATAPDYFVYANSTLYVHCYDRDYEFEVAYG